MRLLSVSLYRIVGATEHFLHVGFHLFLLLIIAAAVIVHLALLY